MNKLLIIKGPPNGNVSDNMFCCILTIRFPSVVPICKVHVITTITDKQ